jgi:hypothetical protein
MKQVPSKECIVNSLHRFLRSSLLSIAAALAAVGALLALPCAAQAAGRLADVTVVDRDTGQVLPLYAHRGEYWVAGRPGARYAVRVANRSTERLLAVTAVDGVNVVTGDTAAFGQTGYVFAPWQSYDIDGWRKSDSEVAAFLFTAAPASYAARTGRPFNVGVIGVALFRERTPEPPSVAQSNAPAPPPAPWAQRAEQAADATASSESAPVASGGRSAFATPSASEARAKLGTGHGSREYSVVEHTGFERRSTQPDEIIRIRYDSTENLVAMGVIRRPPLRGRPEAFPDSPLARYVPDPR